MGRRTPNRRPGDLLKRARESVCVCVCVCVCGPTASPTDPCPPAQTCSLSQSLCWKLLPLGSGALMRPLLFTAQTDNGSLGPIPSFPGCSPACQLTTLQGWPQTQQPLACQGQQEPWGPCRQRPRPPPESSAPHGPALSKDQAVWGSRGAIVLFQGLALSEGTPGN